MADDVESKSAASQKERVSSSQERQLKLDPHGFPLRPQPTDDPKDPLNWNQWLKLWVLVQVSFLAFLGPFTQAVINAAFHPLAVDFHVSIVRASYVTTLAIATAGLAPLIWSPLSNVYGRRPIFIFVTAVGVACHCASAVARSYGGMLAARAFVGIGTSAGMGIGAAVVADMYFMHERGKYMGIYVVFLSNGAHLAAIIGGYIALRIGYRWCFWIPGIILGVNWLVNVFGLPETLYHRNNATGESRQPANQAWVNKFLFRSIHGTRRLTWWDFTHCFIMFKYPSVLFSTIYYSISFGLGSVLFAVTGAAAFGEIYHFNTAQVGLAIGVSTFVGTLLGELAAGPVSDYLLLLYTRAHQGESRPEARLHAIWPGAFLVPVGVIIEGVCFQAETHYMGPVMGIAIAAFGLQIISTNIFAYMTDCYKPQAAEMSTLLNFGRQEFSMTLGFYMIPFAEATTFGTAWGLWAVIQVLFFLPMVALMWKGAQWREKLGSPNFHKEL